MLDRFTWTGGTVFAGNSARVVAAIDPSMNLLAAFTDPGAVFGFVLDGQNAVLRRNGMAICLAAGCYFVASPDTAELASPGGRILLIQQAGRNFPFLMGGPVEARGRLRYIDGCTDSLLIAPWRRGEACLNLLHIPAGVEQTMHTHPSDRIGVVVDGRGQCVTPEGVVELSPGKTWRTWFDDLVALWPEAQQRTIRANVAEMIELHNRKTVGRAMPMETYDPLSGCSWRFLCEVVIRGDLKNRRMGSMQMKGDQTRKKLGITLEQALAEIK